MQSNGGASINNGAAESGQAGNGTVLWSLDSRGVATVTLNRPNVNNAYNGDMISGLHEAMDILGVKPGLRVVVLKGNGKHFQAGADLAWINAQGKLGPDANLKASEATGQVVRRLNELPVATVAMVQGGCFGGGTGVAAACDVVVAADNAIFAITEARWGLMASIIFPQLVQAIGLRQVRRYALTCERMDALKAQQIGFVHEVCPLEDLEATTQKIVDALLMSAPQATATTKRLNMEIAGAVMSDALFEDLVQRHANTRRSDEAAEGTLSFIEKRHPAWYKPREQ
ncbi:enoyl-CoA hydratase-related protein [Orrella daihaiensis]|uniref:Enoyl-CoA hydratase/isomerase family protein n=1 Tax=Orrella daihaiensis TaxID=2782176 RepID=A0ABY4AJC7_9BURK|nr:enoyl-CoA hydratase-related protein [Orrella daihaiensis]UOD49505.1 enoyl-CoA hydratase/isomerase family protein [Orrella daihaiensis]